MAAVIELVANLYSLFMLVFMFGLKIMFMVIHTWVELVKATIIAHLNMFRRTMIWIITLILLPIRVLTALQRERLLEECLQEMQIELDNLVWDRKELQCQLQTSLKEQKIFDSMLAELEEENDSAIAKIELLEGELQDLKVENLKLKETLDKGHWSFKGSADTDNGQDIGISYGIQSQKSGSERSGIIIEDLIVHKEAREGESKGKAELLSFLKPGSTASGPIHQFTPVFLSSNLNSNEVLEQRREVALSQSLFSAGLSLLVGMIIWEAEDPCMPLVVALFTVVGMSLKSVVQFFSTIKNKPASDAVALLSFNWFILGTLTYPTLPKLARMLGPLTLRFFGQGNKPT